MKILIWLILLPIGALAMQTLDLHQIRELYRHAPQVKKDAFKFNKQMQEVDSRSAAPVLVCYKGANEMIQAKYSLNPLVKLERFNKGKKLIRKAICRDTLNLEMRFIRYSIQSNLPAFLGYHDELATDKQFLLANTNVSKDTELREMILTYLSAISITKPDELKQLKN
jgi:hypothetical protein